MKYVVKLCKVATLLTVLLLAPTLAAAHGQTDEATLIIGSEQHSLQERVMALEERQAEIYHSLAEKKAAGLGSKISERISMSGLIELEVAVEKIEYAAGGSDSSSDLTLATVQVGLVAEMTEQIHGNIVLLHEEDGADLEVDEAAVDLDFAPLFGRVGRIYIPFGVFSSHFINSPLTQELGETRETAALIGYGQKYFSLAGYIFNGDSEKVGKEDQIRDWGLSLVLTPEEGVEFGCSYLSDLADSDAELVTEYQSRVAGWSAYFVLERGALGLNGEVLGAAKSFSVTDLDENGDGKGDQLLTWNIEASWALDRIELAARIEGSNEFAGHPELQYGLGASWSPWEHSALSIEYLHGEFKSGFDRDEDGNLLDQRDLMTAQWAFEF